MLRLPRGRARDAHRAGEQPAPGLGAWQCAPMSASPAEYSARSSPQSPRAASVEEGAHDGRGGHRASGDGFPCKPEGIRVAEHSTAAATWGNTSPRLCLQGHVRSGEPARFRVFDADEPGLATAIHVAEVRCSLGRPQPRLARVDDAGVTVGGGLNARRRASCSGAVLCATKHCEQSCDPYYARSAAGGYT